MIGSIIFGIVSYVVMVKILKRIERKEYDLC